VVVVEDATARVGLGVPGAGVSRRYHREEPPTAMVSCWLVTEGPGTAAQPGDGTGDRVETWSTECGADGVGAVPDDPDEEHPASPITTATVPAAAIIRPDRKFIVTCSSEAHQADLGNECLRQGRTVASLPWYDAAMFSECDGVFR
jgi:hypothetical protein